MSGFVGLNWYGFDCDVVVAELFDVIAEETVDVGRVGMELVELDPCGLELRENKAAR